MSDVFCQSCAMPMTDEEMYGTNKDKSKNADYCKYCFSDGVFTANCSMEEMIEICVPPMVNANKGMSENEARDMMKKFFPTLKRWQ